MKSFHSCSSLSRLTLNTTSGCPSNFFAMVRMWGRASRQGPHQVAQKSSSTTFPLKSSSETRLPSSVVTANGGGHPGARQFRLADVPQVALPVYVSGRSHLHKLLELRFGCVV